MFLDPFEALDLGLIQFIEIQFEHLLLCSKFMSNWAAALGAVSKLQFIGFSM